MSLSDYKLTDADVAQKGVVAAPDKLTGTAAQNKALFDRLIRETVKVLYNGLIDELSGNDGAENIGVDGIEGLTAQNVQHALSELAAKLFSLDAADIGVEAQLSIIQPENVSDALVQICDELVSYQPTLNFDSTPTAGSLNPVTSSGIKTALDAHFVTAGQKSGTTLGFHATAEGVYNEASGWATHAEGAYNLANVFCAHAEGIYTVASGRFSHAQNDYATASGESASAAGEGTISNHKAQLAFGMYNAQDPSAAAADQRGSYIEIVGNGVSNASRSNARTLDWSGNEVLAGKLTLGAAPTADMDAATKKYVDDAIAAAIANLGT